MAGLTPRKKTRKRLTDLRFGFWNVRTLYQSKKLQVLIEQMDSYRVDLLAIQEMRWTGSGMMDTRGHTVCYSCHDTKHSLGTGFILNKEVKHIIMDFQAVSPRLCYLRLRGKFNNYSIINVHAPTEEKEDEEKDEFYEELDHLWVRCPRHDVQIIMGDFNAKVGKEEEFCAVIGRNSLHSISNENGIRILSFAASHSMVIGSTLFQHKDIHKATWTSPDDSTYNQIDHILIDSRHVSNLLDIRTFRGANADSDHFLVICKIREKIAMAKNSKKPGLTKFNCNKLGDPKIRKEYQTVLTKKLSENVLNDDDDVNRKWNSIKRSILSAAEKILEKERAPIRQDWFDNECRPANENKNKAYRKMIVKKFTRNATEEYKQARRDEKRLHKSKKKCHKENLMQV